MERGNPGLLLKGNYTPMEAVFALYSEHDEDLAEAIIASLNRQIFEEAVPEASGRIRRRLAWAVHRLLKRTTRAHVRTGPDGKDFVVYRNRLIERSHHPYALTLLEPSEAEVAAFVEGGDPMNAPYMMISPEISRNARTWDRLFLDSVQGRDVQLRFIWETKFTYEAAKARLERNQPVRLKAAAAGTGLSMILVFDHLIREGYPPELISATITDRDPANVAKTERLLGKLRSTREHHADTRRSPGISARTRDLLHPVTAPGTEPDPAYDIITLMGILEYFRGFTCATTEEHLGLPVTHVGTDAQELLGKIGEMTADSGILIANSYRTEIGARILEIFGKRLYFRKRKDLQDLAATAGFVSTGKVGSGNVYDVEVFQKREKS
jgi:hypothetical protein